MALLATLKHQNCQQIPTIKRKTVDEMYKTPKLIYKLELAYEWVEMF